MILIFTILKILIDLNMLTSHSLKKLFKKRLKKRNIK